MVIELINDNLLQSTQKLCHIFFNLKNLKNNKWWMDDQMTKKMNANNFKKIFKKVKKKNEMNEKMKWPIGTEIFLTSIF